MFILIITVFTLIDCLYDYLSNIIITLFNMYSMSQKKRYPNFKHL